MRELKIIMSLAAAFLLFGCSHSEDASEDAQKTVRVIVRRIELESIAETITLTGEALPHSSILFTSKAPGRLEKLSIADEGGRELPLIEGMKVKKGQRLAVIDNEVYLANYRRAEAVLQSAKAQRDEAAREEQRMAALFEQGATTEQARDKSVTADLLAQAALLQAQSAMDLARIDLEESSPKSPIDGIIVAKHLDEGNVVTSGTPIVTIEDLSVLKVVLHAPDRLFNRLVPGATKALLSADAIEGQTIEAVITKVHPSIHKATRTVPIELLLDNSQGKLAPGMFVRAEIEIERKESVPIVRSSELLKLNGETFVHLVSDDRAQRRQVRLGISQDDRFEVIEGLSPEDRVVTQSQRNIEHGTLLAIIKEESQ